MKQNLIRIALVLPVVAALPGCAGDLLERTGFNAMSQHACQQERPRRSDCLRSYDAEYERYRDERERLPRG